MRWTAGLALGLLVLLSGEIGSGSAAVLAHQPSADTEIVALITQIVPVGASIQPHLAPEETLAKYSVVAHRFAPGANQYMLWSTRSGQPKPSGAALLATSGQYQLFRQGLR